MVAWQLQRQNCQSRGPGFESTCCHSKVCSPDFACCLLVEIIIMKPVGAFYLVSMRREVKDPTQGVNV